MTAKLTKTALPHAAPDHLSDRSRILWESVVPRRAKSLERLAMVQVALESLDRADEAAAAVKAEGLTTVTKTTGAVHLHPLLRVERESRQMFAKIWGQLHLSWSPDIDGRVDLPEAHNKALAISRGNA